MRQKETVAARAERIKKITEGQWWGAVLPLIKHAPHQTRPTSKTVRG